MNAFIRLLGHQAARLLANASIYLLAGVGLLFFVANVTGTISGGSFAKGAVGLVICLILCVPGGMVLDALEKKARKLVERANQQEGLALNTQYLLGLPDHRYFAFDTQHRKIAVCNSTTDTYTIHDFSYIHRWQVDHDTLVRGEVGMGGAQIPGTPMQGPSVGTRTEERGFRLVLEVRDVARPLVTISMRNRADAEQWSARLGAFLNG